MYSTCTNHFKQKRNAILELFEQVLMAGFKTIENKGVECKHTNKNSRKDFYNKEASFAL